MSKLKVSSEKNVNLGNYIPNFVEIIPEFQAYNYPWEIISDLEQLIEIQISKLSYNEFSVNNKVAIHKSAIIESGAIIKPYTIIAENCIVKSGAYLRNGVFLSQNVSIGANCEVKQSIIFPKSRIAHLNYVGNSIIGNDVNLEAGSILANHFNERIDKTIFIKIGNKIVDTKTTKFGSVVGDGCRIGANAVLNPGSVLEKNTVVGRLEHLDQLK